MKEGTHRRGQLTRASALALVLVAAACGYPRTRTNLADRRAADVRSAAVEVVDGSRHGLAGPRQGTLETLARAAAHSPSPFVSAVTAFSVAAEAALRARGIRVEPKYGAPAVLRITLVEFEVHDVLVHRRLETTSGVEDQTVGVVPDDLSRDRVVAPRRDVVGVHDAGAGSGIGCEEVEVLRVV